MTSRPPLRPWELPPGEPVPFSVPHRNLLYPGEAVLSPGWQPALGLPLAGEAFFRIVLLQSYAVVPQEQVQDSRIAVWVPPRRRATSDAQAAREERVLRELRARYAVGEAHQAEDETHRQLYTSGTLLTRTGGALSPTLVFQGPSPEGWLAAIAEALLSWTYPRTPVESNLFPRPLAPEDLRPLFQALARGAGTPEARASAEAFGAGLGLVLGASGDVSLVDAPVLELLRTELARRGGDWPAEELFAWMGHVHGLPHPLVSLLLLLLLSASPEMELRLRPSHHLLRADGRPYQGVALLPETVAVLDFSPHLHREALGLRQATVPSWQAAVLYFSPLAPALTETDAEEQARATLTSALAHLSEEVHTAEEGLRRLAQALGEPMPSEAAVLLEGLGQVASARSPGLALQRTRRLFGSPDGLARALARLDDLKNIAAMADIVAGAARYIRAAPVPQDMSALNLSRQLMTSALTLSELASAAFSPQALEMQVARFRADYQQAYLQHHAQYHRELAALQPLLRQAQLHAQGLERMNTLGHLGGPLGAEALGILPRLALGLSPCRVPASRLDLETSPVCSSCHLTLEQQLATQEIRALCSRIEAALAEKGRALSQLLAARILSSGADQRMERLIQVLQVSDLPAMTSALNDDLLHFIQEVLRTP
ncbi:MAG: hypothetical protein HY680_08170 [Chloroflexi bacterium]|nr:hypothetical protein [Chloroflexota bacterium]